MTSIALIPNATLTVTSSAVCAYGSDCSTWATDTQTMPDLDPYFRELSTYDPRVVAEHAGRMLCAAPGTIIEEPQHGVDLSSWINRRLLAARLSTLRSEIKSAAELDESVERADVAISWDQARKSLGIEMFITPVTTVADSVIDDIADVAEYLL